MNPDTGSAALEQVTRLAQRVDSRYYGKYRGIVTDNDDPKGLGRLRARVPRLLGDTPTGWALPCVPYGGTGDQGLWLLPEVEAAVWMEFEGGDLAFPVWTGTWWGTDERPASATVQQKVLRTRTGHQIVLDDDEGSIVVTDSSGNSVRLDGDGIVLEDANGNSVTLTGDGIAVKAGTVSIGTSATDNLVGFQQLDTALRQFVQQVQAHTHAVTAPGSPTGPPVPPPMLVLDPAKSRHEVEL